MVKRGLLPGSSHICCNQESTASWRNGRHNYVAVTRRRLWMWKPDRYVDPPSPPCAEYQEETEEAKGAE